MMINKDKMAVIAQDHENQAGKRNIAQKKKRLMIKLMKTFLILFANAKVNANAVLQKE